MAKTLSNSGITSGSVIRAAEISQSIDALTGTEAYDITISGSLRGFGPTILTGSVTASGHVKADRFFGAGVFDPGGQQSGFSSGQNLLNVFADGPVTLQQWQTTRTDIMKNTFLRENLWVFEDAYITGSITASAMSSSGDIIAANIDLPGGGRISFDDTNTDDQWIEGGDNNITIVGDQILNLRAAEKTRFQNLAGQLKFLVSSSGYISTSADLTIRDFPSVSASLAAAAGGGGGGGTPAGSDGQVQFNNAGAFGASANFSFNSANGLFAAPHGTFSTMSLDGGNYRIYEKTSENVVFNSEDNAYNTKFIGYDGNGDFEIGDGQFTFKGDDGLKISGSSAAASTIDVSGSISASADGVTMRIDKNSIFSNRPNRMYIGNESTNASAELMFVVGGTGTNVNSSIQINSNQEISLGNPGTSFTYPLGFAAGELASYVQVTNDNAVSSSVLAIKGQANSDGILYVGSNNARGGGMSFKGDATSPFGNLSNLNADKVELYRSDSSTATAYPMLSFPSDRTSTTIIVGTNQSTDADPEFFQLSSRPKITPVESTVPYRRTYHINQQAVNAGAVANSIVIPALTAGTYVLTYQLLGSEDGNPSVSFGFNFKEVWYNFSSGNFPVLEGSRVVVMDEKDGAITFNALTNALTADEITLRFSNTSGINLNFSGYVDVDFVPASVA